MSNRLTIEELEAEIRDLQKDYNYNLKEFTIEIVLSKFRDKTFEYDPNSDSSSVIFIPKYQRDYVWTHDLKCKFIESLFLGIPMPPLFAFTLDDSGNMELIDGVQRLSTIQAFIAGKFKISKLELLSGLNNYKFQDLHPSRQRKFKDLSVRIFVFSERADEGIRADIYNRINSTGKKLTDSEIRKGAFMNNEFYSFILECSESEEFNKLFSSAKTTEKLRGEKEELLSRFFAYSESYQTFVHSVRHFLNDYIIKKGVEGFNKEELKTDLNKVLSFVDTYFPNGFTKDTNFSSIPRVRFEAISVGANLALKINPDLVPEYMDWINSEEFKSHTTSDAANNKNKLLGRIEFVRDCLLNVIKKESLTINTTSNE